MAIKLIMDETWLRQKYLAEGLHCPAIATIVGKDAKTVWSYLKKFNIPTRPRGNKLGQPLPIGFTFRGGKHSTEMKEKLSADRIGKSIRYKNGPAWLGISGPQHPTWKGGGTPDRQKFYASTEWINARTKTYVRAQGRCERCDSRSNLHVHHIIPFAFKKYRAQISNLRVLCAECHRFVHSLMNSDREFLPSFASWPLMGDDGIFRIVSISYHPKHKARNPEWLSNR